MGLHRLLYSCVYTEREWARCGARWRFLDLSHLTAGYGRMDPPSTAPLVTRNGDPSTLLPAVAKPCKASCNVRASSSRTQEWSSLDYVLKRVIEPCTPGAAQRAARQVRRRCVPHLDVVKIGYMPKAMKFLRQLKKPVDKADVV